MSLVNLISLGGCVWDVAPLSDGGIVTSSADGTIRFWKLQDGSCELTQAISIATDPTELKLVKLGGDVETAWLGEGGVRCLAISPDETHLASGDRSGSAFNPFGPISTQPQVTSRSCHLTPGPCHLTPDLISPAHRCQVMFGCMSWRILPVSPPWRPTTPRSSHSATLLVSMRSPASSPLPPETGPTLSPLFLP